ncbi:MAG: tetratricopeptide repeat protein [Planctomycetaceae bacterium]
MKRLSRIAAGIAIAGAVTTAGCRSGQDAASTEAVGWRPLADSSAEEGGSPIDLELSLARTLERDGDPARAAAAYRQILHRYPEQPVANHRLAVVLDQSQRFDESRPLYEKAMALSPKNPELLCDYAFSLYSQNELPRAEELLRQAIDVSPGHLRSHNHLGLVLARTNRRDEAVGAFHAAGCTAAEAHENIALVLSIDGHLAEARTEYLAALAAAPNSVSARSRLEELDGVAVAAQRMNAETDPYPSAHAGRAVVRLTGAESPAAP